METQVKAAIMAGLIGLLGVVLSSVVPHWLEPGQLLGEDSLSHPSDMESKNITTINQMPSLISCVSTLESPQVAGTSILWTVKAGDPDNDILYYKFFLKKILDDDFVPQTGWITNYSWIWTTTEDDIGKNEIQVWVRDSKHSSDPLKGDDCIIKSYIITPQNATSPLNKKSLDLCNQSKYNESIKAYDEAIRLNPSSADAWYRKAGALSDFGKYDEAVKCIDESIKLNPNDDTAWFNKGVFLGEQKKYDEAIKAYEEAFRLNPKDAGILSNKAICLQALGRTSEANANRAEAKEIVNGYNNYSISVNSL